MNRLSGAICRMRCMIPVSVATMNSGAGLSTACADHPFGRGDVKALGIHVAVAHLVDQLSRAPALGMHQHLGVRMGAPASR